MTDEFQDVRLTPHQKSVLLEVCKGNPDGSPIDLDQLVEAVNYKVTKSAIRFTIRRMCRRDLIKKQGHELRRGKNRALFGPGNIGSEVNKLLVSRMAEQEILLGLF